MSPEVIHAMVLPEPGRFDLDVLRDVLEIRAHLDIQMTAMAAERRRDADLEELETRISDVDMARQDIHRYSDALDQFSLAVANATGNRIFLMMVHWHHRVHLELGDLMLAIRQPTEAHTAGLRILLELIRKQDTDGVRTLVEAFHKWATPRLLTAAALRSGIALEQIHDLIEPS
jgi:DNA-binding FadR family transcriptional regulator